MLNVFLKTHDDIQDQIYSNGQVAFDRLIKSADNIIKQDEGPGYIDFIMHQSVAKSVNGIMTADTYEVDSSIYVHTNNLYIIKIEGNFMPDGEIHSAKQAAEDFAYQQTNNYEQKVNEYKANDFVDEDDYFI